MTQLQSFFETACMLHVNGKFASSIPYYQACLNGNPKATFNLALVYWQLQQMHMALDLLNVGADQLDDSRAQFVLGHMYLHGIFLLPNHQLALAYFLRSSSLEARREVHQWFFSFLDQGFSVVQVTDYFIQLARNLGLDAIYFLVKFGCLFANDCQVRESTTIFLYCNTLVRSLLLQK